MPDIKKVVIVNFTHFLKQTNDILHPKLKIKINILDIINIYINKRKKKIIQIKISNKKNLNQKYKIFIKYTFLKLISKIISKDNSDNIFHKKILK